MMSKSEIDAFRANVARKPAEQWVVPFMGGYIGKDGFKGLYSTTTVCLALAARFSSWLSADAAATGTGSFPVMIR